MTARDEEQSAGAFMALCLEVATKGIELARRCNAGTASWSVEKEGYVVKIEVAERKAKG